jgi:hypothetical protein
MNLQVRRSRRRRHGRVVVRVLAPSASADCSAFVALASAVIVPDPSHVRIRDSGCGLRAAGRGDCSRRTTSTTSLSARSRQHIRDRDADHENRRVLSHDRVIEPEVRAALDETADRLRPEGVDGHDLRLVVDEVRDRRSRSRSCGAYGHAVPLVVVVRPARDPRPVASKGRSPGRVGRHAVVRVPAGPHPRPGSGLRGRPQRGD